jgi:hypothetical protein
LLIGTAFGAILPGGPSAIGRGPRGGLPAISISGGSDRNGDRKALKAEHTRLPVDSGDVIL